MSPGVYGKEGLEFMSSEQYGRTLRFGRDIVSVFIFNNTKCFGLAPLQLINYSRHQSDMGGH